MYSLGQDFESLVSKVDSVNTKYRAAVDNTITVAKTQITLVRQVRYLYEDIAALHSSSSSSNRTSSIASSSSSDSSTVRLEARARSLQKDINEMNSSQHACALKFKELGEQFSAVSCVFFSRKTTRC